jgi:hypothetical protein
MLFDDLSHMLKFVNVLCYKLVWTLCLIQVCVYLTRHITKLQLQTTLSNPLYIPHSACIHRDPGRWKSWCLHCLWGYLFLPGFSSLYDAIHGWMMRQMDGWMESFMKNDYDVLYYLSHMLKFVNVLCCKFE